MADSSRQYVTLDVFTQTKYEGNPLAVVELQDGDESLSPAQLQLIAREFNYSETVFLFRRRDEQQGDKRQWKIRIFLTNAEVPFAGHPVIGTAIHIKTRILPRDFNGKLFLNCPAGEVVLDLSAQDDHVRAQIPHDYHLHSTPLQEQELTQLQPALSLEQVLSSQIASPVRGMNFVLTQLRDLDALQAVGPFGVQAKPTLDDGWSHGFVGTAWYVSTGEDNGVKKYQTRMIEKSLEDPATGSMSCGLASYLALAAKTKESTFHFTQGVEMGRRSEIYVTAVLNDDLTTVKSLTLVGTAVHIMKGTLEI